MSKPWSGVGAWALEAEQAEAEEREAAAAAAAAESRSFPSLKEAAAAKPKKKKPVPIPLAQFAADPHVGPTPDADLPLRLPTRPRDRPPDYDHHLDFSTLRRGGGGGGGFRDEPRRGPPQPRAEEIGLPSRADEVDNWAAAKKQFAPPSSSSVVDRGSSRADEVDNWAVGKKPIQSFGSGFRTSFGSDSDRWVRGGGGFSSSNGERKRLVLDPPKRDGGNVRTELSRPSPFGAARPREEVLAEKGLDWKKIDSEIESKKATSRPTSSHLQSYSQSSRPSSAQSSRAENPGVQVGTQTRVNPFGDAKPREVLLEAKGKDWRKIDLELEHRRIDRPETDEEKLLKEEIDNLKSQAKNMEENLKTEGAQFSAEELASLQVQILDKERELEILTCQLDDKVRFGQKATIDSRPNSVGGRPHSRFSIPEEPRSLEFMKRPRSRGGMVDKRGGFQWGFFSDRNLERPRSGARW